MIGTYPNFIAVYVCGASLIKKMEKKCCQLLCEQCSA